MASPSSVDEVFGNLLLTNILLIKGELDRPDPRFALVADHEKTRQAWARVMTLERRQGLDLSDDSWCEFLTSAIEQHLGRLSEVHSPSYFLLYLEDGEDGATQMLRTAVPALADVGLLGYPYTDESVINGTKMDGVQVTPPLGTMALPWGGFVESTVAHAKDQSVVYHPDLLNYQRSYLEFDILAGLMSVVTVRVPLEVHLPLQGFLVLGSVHAGAFGAPVQSDDGKPTVNEELAHFLRNLVDHCGVSRNLGAVFQLKQLKKRLADDKRGVLSHAGRRLRHDTANSLKELDLGARTLDELRAKSPSMPDGDADLLEWASSCMRLSGQLLLCQADLFVQAADGNEILVTVEAFSRVLTLWQTYIRNKIAARCDFIQIVDQASVPIPAILQAIAFELIRNSEFHRDQTADYFRLKVDFSANVAGFTLTVESAPHRAQKVANFNEAMNRPLDSLPVKGIPLVRRAAADRGWRLVSTCTDNTVAITLSHTAGTKDIAHE